MSPGSVSGPSPYRPIAIVHVGAGVAINILGGLLLVVLAGSPWAVRRSFQLVGRFTTEQRLLRDAPGIVDLASTGVLVAGIALVVLGVIGAVLLRRAIADGTRRPAAIAATVTALNPLVLPLAVIAATLLVVEGRMTV